MKNASLFLFALLFAGTTAPAQDASEFLRKFQVHGNVSQGFLLSSGNNYMTADSKDGSGRWTEGTLSIMRPINDQIRAGFQVHSYRLGQIGRQRVTLDWGYVDYQPSRYFGVRAGKVKSAQGLFNDSQDIDAVHQWALLPQAIYPADNRGFTLAHTGGSIYGSVDIGKKLGTVEYQFFGGSRSQDETSGFALSMAALGIHSGSSTGPVVGADLRWRLPVPGLMVGASWLKGDLTSSDSRIGPMPIVMLNSITAQTFYTQYERGRLTLSGEMQLHPIYEGLKGTPQSYRPMRGWYGMGSYHLTSRLTVGAYYSHLYFFLTPSRDKSDPANYQQDRVINARFDINRFFYVKAEGHFLDGTVAGVYTVNNPNGVAKETNLFLARVGFTF